MLLFATQSFASTPSTLSSMLSEESLRKFQELTPDVQYLVRDRLFPEVLKEVQPENQREVMEAIVSTTHEQQSDSNIRSRGWYVGTRVMPYNSVSWTGNPVQQPWITTNLNLKQTGGYCIETTEWCNPNDCRVAIASLSLPDEPGEYNATGTHEAPVFLGANQLLLYVAC